MLSRNVARHAEKAGKTNWMWEKIWDYLRASDFVFWNLEGATNGTDIYSYEKTLTFNALPKLIKTLPEAGFSIVNLANNHALDQDEEGLKTTREFLQKIGISQVGTGNDSGQAWTPTVVEKNGIKIAFIGASYTSYNDDGTRRNPMIARMQDTEKLKTALEQAKREADMVVVTMHAGMEYTRKPTPLQESFAHTAIENGADIVIGAHPHWVQTVENYQWKYIFYSLWNFVFDQEFSEETTSGMTLRITVEKTSKTHISKIELIPIIIENYGQPRLATGDEKTKILDSIWEKNDTFYGNE